MTTIKLSNSSIETSWQRLPPEIQTEILNHLSSPADALNFSMTDCYNHKLVVGMSPYWSLHGVVKPPIARNAAPKTWASMTKLLMPYAKEKVPDLIKPLDVSSSKARSDFATNIYYMNRYVHLAESYYNMFSFVNPIEEYLIEAEMYAQKAGVKMPSLSEDVRFSYLESIDMRKGQVPQNATDSQIRFVWRGLYPTAASRFR